jgi:DHA1 family bicyclomycin/chloramphenicol resistance-like MFS transporter
VTPAAGLIGLIAALFFVLFTVGLAIPAASAAAIGSRPERAGATSGLLGTVQFGIGGTIGTAAALAGGQGPATLAVIVAVCRCCALALTGLAAARPEVVRQY